MIAFGRERGSFFVFGNMMEYMMERDRFSVYGDNCKAFGTFNCIVLEGKDQRSINFMLNLRCCRKYLYRKMDDRWRGFEHKVGV